MLKRWFIVIGLAGLTGILMLGFLAGLANNTPVVVATHALSVGQTITEADVALRPVHASAVSDGAITTLEEVVGKRLGQTRLAGDQITQAALAGADNPLVPALDEGNRAMAVKVTDNQGLLGTLRPGDTVSVIGVTGQGSSAQSRLVLSGLRVLLVSYDFRYSEPAEPVASDQSNLSSLSSRQQRVREGVVVLQVPVEPISLTVGITATTSANGVVSTAPLQVSTSPVEVLALLNNDQDTKIHLALEPVGALAIDTPGISLANLFPEIERPFDATTSSTPLYVPVTEPDNAASGGQP
jgi:Flp pilus assembly protein CpaB